MLINVSNSKIEKDIKNAVFPTKYGILFWQGYKDSNLGHAVLEAVSI